jgi:hypothetical protein
MSVEFEVTVEGAETLARKLELMPTRYQQDVDRMFQGQANIMKGRAYVDSPVLTGFLRSTIFAMQKGALTIYFGAWCWYAPSLEYGTRYITPRLFLTRAFEAQLPQIENLMHAIARQVIKELSSK